MAASLRCNIDDAHIMDNQIWKSDLNLHSESIDSTRDVRGVVRSMKNLNLNSIQGKESLQHEQHIIKFSLGPSHNDNQGPPSNKQLSFDQ
jgi:hypothetical protein